MSVTRSMSHVPSFTCSSASPCRCHVPIFVATSTFTQTPHLAMKTQLPMDVTHLVRLSYSLPVSTDSLPLSPSNLRLALLEFRLVRLLADRFFGMCNAVGRCWRGSALLEEGGGCSTTCGCCWRALGMSAASIGSSAKASSQGRSLMAGITTRERDCLGRDVWTGAGCWLLVAWSGRRGGL